MAKRGTTRAQSDQHENAIAALYGGKKTSNSGATDREKGDVLVIAQQTLFECKSARPKRIPKTVREMEKVASEAYSEGKEPALALRYFLPESPLAGFDGHVDLVVRLAREDAARREGVGDASEHS